MPTSTTNTWFLHFDAPGRIWSTNDERKMHHMARAELVKAWRDAAFWHYKNQLARVGAPDPAIVEVHIPVPDKRRRDPMNYCGTIVKSVVDGLVLAGAWPDDTPDHVRHLEPLLSREKERVYVFIHPGDSRRI